jgi:GTPase SAR1 family protein
MSGEKRIAILGLKGSGKSTFLSVLNLALSQKNSPWRIRPVGGSITSLIHLQEYIFAKGLFPSATHEESPMAFLVEKEATMLGLQPGARFQFYTTDIPGEAVKGRSSQDPAYHDFYEQNLKGCSGIIFLLDPEETWRRDSIDENIDVYYPLFNSILAEIKNQAEGDVFIAFCLTKLDMVLPVDSDFALHGVLRDIEIRAEQILGKATKKLINNYFESDHISWFPVSSIGYISEENRGSSQFTIREVDDGYELSGIKNPRELTPIGIADAMEWILNSVTDYSEESRIEKTRGKRYSEIVRSLRKLLDR